MKSAAVRGGRRPARSVATRKGVSPRVKRMRKAALKRSHTAPVEEKLDASASHSDVPATSADGTGEESPSHAPPRLGEIELLRELMLASEAQHGGESWVAAGQNEPIGELLRGPLSSASELQTTLWRSWCRTQAEALIGWSLEKDAGDARKEEEAAGDGGEGGEEAERAADEPLLEQVAYAAHALLRLCLHTSADIAPTLRSLLWELCRGTFLTVPWHPGSSRAHVEAQPPRFERGTTYFQACAALQERLSEKEAEVAALQAELAASKDKIMELRWTVDACKEVEGRLLRENARLLEEEVKPPLLHIQDNFLQLRERDKCSSIVDLLHRCGDSVDHNLFHAVFASFHPPDRSMLLAKLFERFGEEAGLSAYPLTSDAAAAAAEEESGVEKKEEEAATTAAAAAAAAAATTGAKSMIVRLSSLVDAESEGEEEAEEEGSDGDLTAVVGPSRSALLSQLLSSVVRRLRDVARLTAARDVAEELSLHKGLRLDSVQKQADRVVAQTAALELHIRGLVAQRDRAVQDRDSALGLIEDIQHGLSEDTQKSLVETISKLRLENKDLQLLAKRQAALNEFMRRRRLLLRLLIPDGEVTEDALDPSLCKHLWVHRDVLIKEGKPCQQCINCNAHAELYYAGDSYKGMRARGKFRLKQSLAYLLESRRGRRRIDASKVPEVAAFGALIPSILDSKLVQDGLGINGGGRGEWRALPRFVLDFLCKQCGLKSLALKELEILDVALKKYYDSDSRCRLFGRLLGSVDLDHEGWQSTHAFRFFLFLLTLLYDLPMGKNLLTLGLKERMGTGYPDPHNPGANIDTIRVRALFMLVFQVKQTPAELENDAVAGKLHIDLVLERFMNRWYEGYAADVEKGEALFRYHDTDGNGTITEDEFGGMLAGVGSYLPASDTEAVFRSYSKKGGMTFDAFMDCFLGLKNKQVIRQVEFAKTRRRSVIRMM